MPTEAEEIARASARKNAERPASSTQSPVNSA